MDFRVVLALGLVVTCGVEGCSFPPSLSLSLLSGHKTHNSLQCVLCLDRKATSRGNFTFTLTRNGKVVKFSQVIGRKISYSLDPKKNNTGLWRCNVQEFPGLSAEYTLPPPTTAPPAEKKKATEETHVPPSTMSSRILLTVMTAALLLIIVIIVISFTSGVCIMKRCRRTSAPLPHHKDGERSENFPLTENVSNPKVETDTEVSYVELEIIRDPYRKPSKSHNTIYANVM